MTLHQLHESIIPLLSEYSEVEVYTTNTDSPGENYGAVYRGAVIGPEPENGHENMVVWVK